MPSNHARSPENELGERQRHASTIPFIDMHARYALSAGAMAMAAAVALGAFGAHVLKASLAADAWIAAWVMLAAGALR